MSINNAIKTKLTDKITASWKVTGVSLLVLKNPTVCGNDRSALTKKTKLVCLKYMFRILELA